MTAAIEFRSAGEADLPALAALLADDELGRGRNPPFESARAAYLAAMRAIEADPNNDILIGEVDGEIAAMLQLTFIPGLSYAGGERLQIQSVRVARAARGRGFGRQLVSYAVGLARARGCFQVQLMTDSRRKDAHGFYEELGFRPTHAGMTLKLGG